MSVLLLNVLRPARIGISPRSYRTNIRSTSCTLCLSQQGHLLAPLEHMIRSRGPSIVQASSVPRPSELARSRPPVDACFASEVL
jgi:hypothetical protein